MALLDWAPLAYLGTISYGFYLFHNLIPARFGVLPAHVGHVAIPKIVRDTLPEMLQFALAVLLAHLSALSGKAAARFQEAGRRDAGPVFRRTAEHVGALNTARSRQRLSGEAVLHATPRR